MRSMIFRHPLLLCALSLAPLAAPAATLTYNDTITVFENDLLDGTNVITLPKFDIGLGTLTGVTITATLALPSFTSGVDNDSGSVVGVTVSFATLGSPQFALSANTLAVTLDDFVDSNDFSITTQQSAFNLEPTNGDSVADFNEEPGDPDYQDFTTAPVLVGDAAHAVSSSAFNTFTATVGDTTFTSEIAVNFTTDLNINSGGAGGEVRFQGQIPSATFFTEVVYDYETAPEPGVLVLGGLALGFGLLRRRRP